jgi:hypothetical protein
MRIAISEASEQDLIDGHWLYERQSAGLGDYFVDSVFADIQSLRLYAVLDCRRDPAWIRGRLT